MKRILQHRWLWFLMGVVSIPILSFVGDLFAPLSPRDAIPYEFVREEFTRTFRGDNDHTYTLRSRGSKEEFMLFVKQMKMEDHRVNDARFEKKTENGRASTTITYSDGWITYEEIFT